MSVRFMATWLIAVLGSVASSHAQVVATADPNSKDKGFALAEGISRTSYPDTDYQQPLRPQFHFSSKRNWLNDPNGMLFDGQKYHLYFQHNPLSTEWGNMTWGHAVSEDMIHWKQLDHALLPYQVDGRSGTIFSGTAVIDHQNALGKQVNDQKTICAFFTFASEPKFYQAMAYSTDGGNTFTYWNEGRPVIENQGLDNGERDPKVFWHEPTKQWVMALWVQLKPGRVRWFTSKNLVDWTFASDLMRDWAFECMDVVFLPVDGDPKNVKCVIYDASFDYEVGTFDGTTFHSETKPLRIVNGNFYAAQTFNNAPNNRCVQIGWMRAYHNVAAQFQLPYNQQMAFPCDMTLHQTSDGPRLKVYPIEEIKSLVDSSVEKSDFTLKKGDNAIADQTSLDLVDLDLAIKSATPPAFNIDLPRVSLRYDPQRKLLEHHGINDKGEAVWLTTLENVSPQDGKLELRILVDRMTIEVYANQGESFSAHYLHPDNNPKQYSIHAAEDLDFARLRLSKLKSAWK